MMPIATAHEITNPTICMAVLPCLAVTSQAPSTLTISHGCENDSHPPARCCAPLCLREINARIRGSRNHSPPHAVTPRMRLTIISGVSVPATRRWLVIAPPRNPVRMIAPRTLVVGIAWSTSQMSASKPISHVWSSGVAGLERRLLDGCNCKKVGAGVCGHKRDDNRAEDPAGSMHGLRITVCFDAQVHTPRHIACSAGFGRRYHTRAIGYNKIGTQRHSATSPRGWSLLGGRELSCEWLVRAREDAATAVSVPIASRKHATCP